ncbi:hypothetical protein [Rhodopseudomonas palustris]|nr:hypothetical protein [Rhodopseudomonas palustris]
MTEHVLCWLAGLIDASTIQMKFHLAEQRDVDGGEDDWQRVR